MSTRAAKKIVRAYADALRAHRFRFSDVYLFGSYATGYAREHSDIDVAVVVEHIRSGREYLDQKMRLRHFVLDVDPRIEPILVERRDLQRGTTTMASEVKRHGIRIT